VNGTDCESKHWPDACFTTLTGFWSTPYVLGIAVVTVLSILRGIHNGVASMKTTEVREMFSEVNRNVEGRILPPLILWMLGVPGIIVIALWFFFFRG
jgi:hypothetical protein